MVRSAVLFIEMQNEWLAANGRIRPLMTDTVQFQGAAAAAQRLLDGTRAVDARIVHAGLRFSAGYPELGEARQGLRAAIPQAGTFPKQGDGSRFADGFEPHDGEFVVRGRIGASAFSGSNLDAYLRNNRVERLYLAGFALHVCVLATAWQAHDLGYDVNVVADACAAFTRPQRQVVVEEIVPHLGGVTTVNETLDQLRPAPAAATPV